MARLNTNNTTVQYTAGSCANSFIRTPVLYSQPLLLLRLCHGFVQRCQLESLSLIGGRSHWHFILFPGLTAINYSSYCQINLPKILLLSKYYHSHLCSENINDCLQILSYHLRHFSLTKAFTA